MKTSASTSPSATTSAGTRSHEKRIKATTTRAINTPMSQVTMDYRAAIKVSPRGVRQGQIRERGRALASGSGRNDRRHAESPIKEAYRSPSLLGGCVGAQAPVNWMVTVAGGQ